MAQRVQNDEEGMRSAAVEFSNKSGEFTGDLQTVRADIESLMASWTGETSIKFTQAMQQWQTSFQKVIQALNHMQEVLTANITANVATEDQSTTTATGLAGIIPGA